MSLGDLFGLWRYADDLAKVWCYLIAAASVIVRFTPTLKDNNVLLKIIKFTSKWLAVNRKTKDDILRSKR